MAAVILLSHGSVMCGAERNLLELAARWREESGDDVQAAFLNYSSPDFLDAVAACAARGARELRVVPFFLVAGKFVRVDLPPRVEEARRRFPQLSISVAEPIGYDSRLADAILHCAAAAQAPSAWREVRDTIGELCRNDARCPVFGTPQCPSSEEKTR